MMLAVNSPGNGNVPMVVPVRGKGPSGIQADGGSAGAVPVRYFYRRSDGPFYTALRSQNCLKNALLLCGLPVYHCAYGVTALSLNPLLSLAGCAVCSFGVSLLWPGTQRHRREVPREEPPCLPAGGGGDMGCALGPFLTGQVSSFSQSLPVAAELCQSFGITLEQFGLKGQKRPRRCCSLSCW